MAGNCIVDARSAELSRDRAVTSCLCQQKITGTVHESERYKLESADESVGLNVGSRAVEQQAHARSEATGGAPG